jgi:glycosyltransferase involved in cell wall biosynthesis
MNVVWLSWKDRSHPLAGGAETVSGQIMDRLARDGHSVKHLTASYQGAKKTEVVNGVEIIRVGNRYSVYLKAKKLYKQTLTEWPNLVIDEMNTIPFAAALYTKRETILLSYQLARKIWFYQMVFPLSAVGYLLEPFYLRLLARHYPLILTESESTRKDMTRYGFDLSRIRLFRVGMALEPLDTLPEKKVRTLILSLGAIRPMKRTLHAVKAFEAAHEVNSSLQMVIAGDTNSKYAQKVLQYIKHSRHASAIDVRGRVSNEERLKLMRNASLILVTSVKEGWGLIVTEANSQGTPAVAYDTDGLRDSVQHRKTGLLVADGDFSGMGKAIIKLLASDADYNSYRAAAWEWSKSFTFDNSYRDFVDAVSLNEPAS